MGYDGPQNDSLIQQGLASQADKPRSGRPVKATEHYVEVLKEAAQHYPRNLDFRTKLSSWTKTMILMKRLVVSSISAIRTTLERRMVAFPSSFGFCPSNGLHVIESKIACKL